jgi:Fe-S-cluster-containing hydrogenase component 2
MADINRISVDAERCAGCLLCCLACSFFNTKEGIFSLSRSMISVKPNEGEAQFHVEFLEECVGCGICVDYCYFGALTLAA